MIPYLTEHDDAVAFEVANEEFFATDSDITGLSHVVAAIEPTDQLARLGDNEDSRGDGIDGNYVSGGGDRQSGHDVDVPDRNLTDEMTFRRNDVSQIKEQYKLCKDEMTDKVTAIYMKGRQNESSAPEEDSRNAV